MDSLCASWKHNVSPTQLVKASEDRALWHRMVANICPWSDIRRADEQQASLLEFDVPMATCTGTGRCHCYGGRIKIVAFNQRVPEIAAAAAASELLSLLLLLLLLLQLLVDDESYGLTARTPQEGRLTAEKHIL